MNRFHAHVYFDPTQEFAAAGLRQQVASLFPVRVGQLHRQPVGPHPKGMFQLVIEREDFTHVVVWLMQNRGSLDILVHGDSGNDLQDHTQHVMWLGHSQPLRLDIFAPSSEHRSAALSHTPV